jgi:aminobenzoyl-glutamate transport protein
MSSTNTKAPKAGGGFFGAVERVGNALPDPTTLFFIMIGLLIVVSVIGNALGWNAINPATQKEVVASSLLSGENVRKLLEEMPRTLTNFAPLGTVLVIMLGTGIAERSGYFAAALKSGLRGAPKTLLAPIVAFAGCMSSIAVDAGYVVLVPLGAIIFAAAGRHPLAGLACAFAGVSGGFSANLFPSSLDTLLLGITQGAAQIVDPNWTFVITDNYYVIVVFTFVVTAIAWAITDLVVEPRLGPWGGGESTNPESADSATQLSKAERSGVFWGTVWLVIPLVALALLAMEGGPLRDLVEPGEPTIAALTPFFTALVAGLAIAFFLAGLSYGICTGRYRTDKDAVKDVNDSMSEMGAYIVLAFAAAHFIAMFNWSGLGTLLAISGAEAIRALNPSGPVLMVLVMLFTATLNLIMASASAKWALLAPIVVPMLMLSGFSPEVTTAAYRLGDSATNIITPMMSYFPMVLIFARRYVKDAGIGTLLALMLPYSIAILLAGMTMIAVWVGFGFEVGPGAGVTYTLPGAS